jgi:hypothetical protein
MGTAPGALAADQGSRLTSTYAVSPEASDPFAGPRRASGQLAAAARLLQSSTLPSDKARTMPIAHSSAASTHDSRAAVAHRGRLADFPGTATEPVSPELALVDPELGYRERLRLHEPAMFRPGFPAVPGAPPPQGAVASAITAPRALRPSLCPVPSPLDSTGDRGSPFVPRPALARSSVTFELPRPRWGSVAAMAAALAVCVGFLWARQEEPPEQVRADPATLATQATGARSMLAGPLPSSHAAPTGNAKTLAWAPAKGALGYEVQLFRGSQRVLLMRTRDPSLRLGATWRYEGRLIRRQRGTYRWYVWPLLQDNRRASTAIVQARVVISPGA